MKLSDLFKKKEKNLEEMGVEIMDASEAIMKKGLAASMKFETLQHMSTEDFELMRDCSKLYEDSKEYVKQTGVRLDMIPGIVEELRSINRTLVDVESLLHEMATHLSKLGNKKASEEENEES